MDLNSKSGMRIAPVVSASMPAENPMSNIFSGINILSAISDAYARTLSYRLEYKRLEVEEQRIEAQAGLIHDQIDKAYRLKMAELVQRRYQLERFYDTVQGDLTQCYVERSTLLEMKQQAHRALLDSGISIEERDQYLEACRILSTDLLSCGARSTLALEQIVRALPVLSDGNLLLEDK